jgi:MOSC domain-containing protein YiiM
VDVDLTGKIVAVASDPTHGFSKPTRSRIVLVDGYGVEGDAHAGPYVRHRYLARKEPQLANLRQVHLMAVEFLDELRAAGYDVRPGELGENITTTGLDLTRLPLGTMIRLGETGAIELTGLRTPCALINRFRKDLKKEMIRKTAAGAPKFRCGVMGIVTAGGPVAPGDAARAELPLRPWVSLPAL